MTPPTPRTTAGQALLNHHVLIAAHDIPHTELRAAILAIEAEAAGSAAGACPRCGLVWPHTATFRSPGEKEQHSWLPSAPPDALREALERLRLQIEVYDAMPVHDVTEEEVRLAEGRIIEGVRAALALPAVAPAGEPRTTSGQEHVRDMASRGIPGNIVHNAVLAIEQEAFTMGADATLDLTASPAEAAPPDALREALRTWIGENAMRWDQYPHGTTVVDAEALDAFIALAATAPVAAVLDVERLARAVNECWALLLAPGGGTVPGLRMSAEAIAAAYAAEAAQPQREGLRDRLLDSPDLPPLPWSSAADRQPWPNDASDHRRIVDANGKPLFSRNWKESCAAIEYLVRAANRAALAIAQPTESCSGCHGRRWTEDENWQPDDPVTWHGERTHRNGLIPCGFCNHGGWTTPDYEPAAAQPAEDEL